MLFSADDKHLIKVLREEKKHYTAREFLRELPNKKWSRGGLNHLLEKIGRYGCVERLASGRPRSTRTAENVESVCELVHSQEDRPHSHHSVRQR